MSYQPLSCTITGVAPLLLHNGQLANPANQFARRMKSISDKRKKTEQDLMELARLEWLGSLYLRDRQPCIPGEMIEATITKAAGERRKGTTVSAGLYCPGAFLIKYDGPRDVEQLWTLEEFREVRIVRIGKNRVVRTRPRFDNWSVEVTVMHRPDMLSANDVRELIELAGDLKGLGDWRPKYGRFRVD